MYLKLILVGLLDDVGSRIPRHTRDNIHTIRMERNLLVHQQGVDRLRNRQHIIVLYEEAMRQLNA